MQGKGAKKFRKLAVLNRKIIRLSSELETLQYLQDRLEREMTPLASRPEDVASSLQRKRRHNTYEGNAADQTARSLGR